MSRIVFFIWRFKNTENWSENEKGILFYDKQVDNEIEDTLLFIKMESRDNKEKIRAIINFIKSENENYEDESIIYWHEKPRKLNSKEKNELSTNKTYVENFGDGEHPKIFYEIILDNEVINYDKLDKDLLDKIFYSYIKIKIIETKHAFIKILLPLLIDIKGIIETYSTEFCKNRTIKESFSDLKEEKIKNNQKSDNYLSMILEFYGEENPEQYIEEIEDNLNENYNDICNKLSNKKFDKGFNKMYDSLDGLTDVFSEENIEIESIIEKGMDLLEHFKKLLNYLDKLIDKY